MSKPDEVADEGAESIARSARIRRAAIELDYDEAETAIRELSPEELDALREEAPDDIAALEARILFETRAAEERRRSAAAKEHQRATRRVSPVEGRTLLGLQAPPPMELEEPAPEPVPPAAAVPNVAAPVVAAPVAEPRAATVAMGATAARPQRRGPVVAVLAVAALALFALVLVSDDARDRVRAAVTRAAHAIAVGAGGLRQISGDPPQAGPGSVNSSGDH